MNLIFHNVIEIIKKYSMLIIVFYVLFFCLIDFAIYCLLNKKEWLNRNLIGGAILGIIVLVLLQTGIIHFGPIIDNDNFLILIQTVFSCVLINLVGKILIKRASKSTRLTEQIKYINVKGQTFIFTKVIYVFIFGAQLFIIIANP